MLNHIFNSQAKTVTFAAVLLAGSVLISQFLGLIRDRLLAGTFGAGQDLDIYFVAFRIPDFIYGIFIMGGLSTVFLPVFTEYFKKKKEEGWIFVSNTINCFLILLIFTCAILVIFTPQLIRFVAPGFDPVQKSLAVSLTRIMLLSPILFGISSVFSGILHYFNRFFAYAIAPILYNLGIIFGILFFVPVFGLQGLAYGVILGAAFHWFIQIPAAKISGFRYLPIFNFRYHGLIKIFKLMIPRTIGSVAYHVNLIVITAIASTLAVGSVTIFNFANNLQRFPIGLIGLSFALASFPVMSRVWAAGLIERFLENFSSVFRQIFFLIIPISFLMFLLRAQIVRLVLGTGQFGWLETRLTAASLAFFCLGIFAFALIPFLARVFYSFQDTKTPAIIGVFAMAFNVGFCFLLVWLLSFPNIFQEFIINIVKLHGIKDIAVVGLPLAFSASGILQFCLLLSFLHGKINNSQEDKTIYLMKLREIRSSLQKILLASILMTVFTYLTLQAAANLVNMETFLGVLIQAALASLIGIFVYILVTLLLKSPEIKTIKSAILRQFTHEAK